MPNRRLSKGPSRRTARPGGGEGGSNNVSTAQAILGTLLRAEWDARFGIAANVWTDQARNIPLTGSGTPVRAADGVNFKTLPVWKFVSGSSQLMRTGAQATPIIPAGNTFYLSHVSRWPIAGFVSSQVALQCVDAPITVSLGAFERLNATDYRASNASGQNISPSNFDNAVHSWEQYINSAGNYELARDGVVLATSGATTLPQDFEELVIGAAQDPAAFADIFYARVRICTSVPSAAQRAQLLALDRSVWGTP